MSTPSCSHVRTASGVLHGDLSRLTNTDSVYSVDLTLTICADCGHITRIYCQSPAAVCAWLDCNTDIVSGSQNSETSKAKQQ